MKKLLGIKKSQSLLELVSKGYLLQSSKKQATLKNVQELKACEPQSVKLPSLTAEQEKALKSLQAAFKAKAPYPCHLLFGVTGSGKTEVYLQLISWLLDDFFAAETSKPQVLVLVPEISLTPQMTALFSKRFGSAVALCHSALSPSKKWQELERIRCNKAQILIGRALLYLLLLII